MKKFLLPLILVLLSATAFAQTTVYNLKPSTPCSYLNSPLYCPSVSYTNQPGYVDIDFYNNGHTLYFVNNDQTFALTQNAVYNITVTPGSSELLMTITSFSGVDSVTGKPFTGYGSISYHGAKPKGYKYPIVIIDAGYLTITE